MKRLLLIILISLMWVTTAQAGKIVVISDEWTLSNSGWGSPNDPGVFATNVASWFTNGQSGDFLAFSNNFGVTQSNLAAAMTGAGHTWTVSINPALLNNLSPYEGVFIGGYGVDTTILTNYVNAGGNVYIMGGTGFGGSGQAEANFWNPFLNAFGLKFEVEPWNGVQGDIAINSSHPIFNYVDHLYMNNGNDTVKLVSTDPYAQVLVTYSDHGLLAVYDSPAPVPEPVTFLLLGSGLIGLAGARRKFKK